MKIPALLLSSLLAASSSAATAVESVDVEVAVDPKAGTISSTVELEITPVAGSQVVEVLLNRRLEITEIAAEVAIVGFEHLRGDSGPYRYAPQALPLRVRLAAPATGDTFRLRLRYRGEVEPDPYGVIQVHDRWVELVMAYSGWIPFDPSDQGFKVSLRVQLPDGWTATGTGAPRLVDGTWTATAEDVSDVILLASPDMQRHTVGDALSIRHVDLTEPVPDRIAADAERIHDTLTRWFGPSKGGRVELVFAPRERGGGYARPGLVVMLYGGSYDNGSDAGPGFIRYLAHEVSHLWWRGASTTDWEDWLNESFAEMSALMIVRDIYGEEVFQELLERYREASVGTQPVWGLDRNDEAAYTVLYRKGPVLLAELEESIGRRAFLRFLRARLESEAFTTKQSLDTLARVVSPEAKDQLEAELRR